MTTRILACLIATTLAMTAVPAAAQSGRGTGTPAISMSGGYSYLYEAGVGGGAANTYDTGWLASVGRRIGDSRFALVGEAGVNSRLDPVGETQRLWGLLAGVRLPLVRLGRMSTFAQALAGIEVFREPGFNEKGPAFQPGVGLDLPVWGPLGLRVQADFRAAVEEGTTFKEGRAGAGIVLNFR